MLSIRALCVAAILVAALPAMAEDAGPPQGSSELIQRFQIKEARQGVGVDANAFYAVDNTVIAKYDKKTGAPIAKWEGDAIIVNTIVQGAYYFCGPERMDLAEEVLADVL